MKRINVNKVKVYFIVISILINLIISISLISDGIKGISYDVGENECINNINLIINNTISNQNINRNKVFVYEYKNEELVAVSFENNLINKYIASINKSIVEYIDNTELKYDVPLLHKSSNLILRQLSPKIPVVYSLIGNANVSGACLVSGYGINNTLLEVMINIQLNMRVIIPFRSDTFTIERTVPLISKVIQGDIPSAYLGSNNTNTIIPVN
ncbi:MAG: hypothetical protein E7184_02655 [Erysipelotrichaceae bacterium]|nr:hypothetical protein [Erysipelotrichaceae bacterium]